MDLKSAAETANQLVTAVAVVVGGTWAYLKFVRGRTFKHRVKVNTVLTLTEAPESRRLVVTVTLENQGLSKLELNVNMKAVRVLGAPRPDPGYRGPASWELISSDQFFDQHTWLEPQEAVSDALLYMLPKATPAGAPYAAYQVEAIVGSTASGILRKKTRWISRSICVIGEPNAQEGAETGQPTEIAVGGGEEVASSAPGQLR